MNSRLLIKNATLVTMDENRGVIDSGDLLIENNIIKAISPGTGEVPGDTDYIRER